MQQVRIVDYLSRDVNRGLSVTTSVDLQTLTVDVPNYIIQAGDFGGGGKSVSYRHAAHADRCLHIERLANKLRSFHKHGGLLPK